MPLGPHADESARASSPVAPAAGPGMMAVAVGVLAGRTSAPSPCGRASQTHATQPCRRDAQLARRAAH
ncbi:hypothetical protein WG70_28780 [Burkholderia oklahomensis EO147]|nr:hypothetical protein WG70_28780 [Burkholderia oklahomensis EO147]AOI47043.1 hypothetical protein WI23_15375 [Burkholderia oklahomensis C6786]KUY54010.1 hypothetical protein WG70_12825 [Burkholderia oklahomensis EO147]KUY59926.1 hypothetical protein WI23_15130 [Burkholderia oklahomensis C6786]